MKKAAAVDAVRIARNGGLQAAVIERQGEYGVRVVHKEGRRWTTTILMDADDIRREYAKAV